MHVLEAVSFFTFPSLFALLVNYINLAEAVDKDSYALYTEDDLEQHVESNSQV